MSEEEKAVSLAHHRKLIEHVHAIVRMGHFGESLPGGYGYPTTTAKAVLSLTQGADDV